MPHDDFLNFVLDQLDPLRVVGPRKMFGGVGLYYDGVFFGIVARDTLYFKTDESTRSAYEAEHMSPFVATPKITLHSYYEVPPGVLENRHQLCDWALAAIQAQRRAQQAAPKPARPKKTAPAAKAKAKPPRKKSAAKPSNRSKS